MLAVGLLATAPGRRQRARHRLEQAQEYSSIAQQEHRDERRRVWVAGSALVALLVNWVNIRTKVSVDSYVSEYSPKLFAGEGSDTISTV